MLIYPVSVGISAGKTSGSSLPPVFLSVIEKKIPRRKGSIIEFYLVDRQGHRHLAVIAEDNSGGGQSDFITEVQMLIKLCIWGARPGKGGYQIPKSLPLADMTLKASHMSLVVQPTATSMAECLIHFPAPTSSRRLMLCCFSHLHGMARTDEDHPRASNCAS